MYGFLLHFGEAHTSFIIYTYSTAHFPAKAVAIFSQSAAKAVLASDNTTGGEL